MFKAAHQELLLFTFSFKFLTPNIEKTIKGIITKLNRLIYWNTFSNSNILNEFLDTKIEAIKTIILIIYTRNLSVFLPIL